MATKLKNLTITRVALVPAGSNPQADIVLFKSKPGEPPTQPKESVFMKKHIDTSKLSADEVTALNALLTKSATDIADTPAAPPEPEVPADVMKSLPPAVQAFIQKTQKAAEDAQAAAEKAMATATLEKAAREENEFVAASGAIVKGYPGKADENARLLFTISKKLGAADYAKVETLFKAGAAALAQAEEVLGDDKDNTPRGNAQMVLKEKAEEIRKANPKLSKNEAYEQACLENMDLVRELRRPRRANDDE